jgi:hypothetical protein
MKAGKIVVVLVIVALATTAARAVSEEAMARLQVMDTIFYEAQRQASAGWGCVRFSLGGGRVCEGRGAAAGGWTRSSTRRSGRRAPRAGSGF